MLKTSNMQSATVSNRFILGVVAFGVSFGLSLVLHWDFNKAFFTGVITVPATYLAALFVDKRRRGYEMLILDSLHKRIKDLEGLKSNMVAEINQLETHHALLYKESNQLQNQIVERRNQRDNLNRELGKFFIEKKQIEAQLNSLREELSNLEKTKVEINNSFSVVNAEKRRLELSCNVTKAEITQLQSQIYELLQQKQDLESNLTLLERLRPQLEEKLYELRVELQKLESEGKKQNQSLVDKRTEKQDLEVNLNSLKLQISEQQTQAQHLQEQVRLLQDERDYLQSQVWELLQQIETLSQETSAHSSVHEEDVDLFPFSDLIESIDTIDFTTEAGENISEEWTQFVEQLPGHEIQVLKAILEQDNPSRAIKKIAEEQITMPNLLIDSINERANDTVGELIIDPGAEFPEIYPEYRINVKKAIAIYEDIMTKQTSSN